MMDKLIQQVNWNLPNLPSRQLYVYGQASVEANKEMQEPLEKLYQYENQPDMREKVKEYIGELDAEYDRLEGELEKRLDDEACVVTELESVMRTLMWVKNDLQGRLEEVI